MKLWRRILDRIRQPQRGQNSTPPRPAAPPSFTCPRCSRTTYHPVDIRYGYCSPCKDYTGAPAAL